LTTKKSWFDSRQGQQIFLYSEALRPALGPPAQLHIHLLPAVTGEAGRPPAFSAEVIKAHLHSVRRLSKSAKSQVTFALQGAMIRADQMHSAIVMLPKLVYSRSSVYSYALPQGGTVSAPPGTVNIQRTVDTRHALGCL